MVTATTDRVYFCEEHYQKFESGEWDEIHRQGIAGTCPECLRSQREHMDVMQEHYTIDPTQPYGKHIMLYCINHPHLEWTTKNIEYIGARTIFYRPDPKLKSMQKECSCTVDCLRYVGQEA